MNRLEALDVLAELTAEREQAREAFDDADNNWRAGIRGALDFGATRVETAQVAGITRQRVQQIEERRR